MSVKHRVVLAKVAIVIIAVLVVLLAVVNDFVLVEAFPSTAYALPLIIAVAALAIRALNVHSGRLSLRNEICSTVENINAFMDEEFVLLNDSLNQIRDLAQDAVFNLTKNLYRLSNHVNTQKEVFQDLMNICISPQVIENLKAEGKDETYLEGIARIVRQLVSVSKDMASDPTCSEDDVVEAVNSIEATLSQYLAELSDSSSKELGNAVRSLQFEDIVTQLVGEARSQLKEIGELSNDLGVEVRKLRLEEHVSLEVAYKVVQQIQKDIVVYADRARVIRKPNIEQTSLTEGTVEFFSLESQAIND